MNQVINNINMFNSTIIYTRVVSVGHCCHIIIACVRRRGENIHPQILFNVTNVGRQGILVFY
jgi:hypothetical protein